MTVVVNSITRDRIDTRIRVKERFNYINSVTVSLLTLIIVEKIVTVLKVLLLNLKINKFYLVMKLQILLILLIKNKSHNEQVTL